MTVRLAVVDLVRRLAVVRAVDDGNDAFPHVLRGTLAAMFAEPTWHVVVAFEEGERHRPAVAEVLDQARRWARERNCRFSVTTLRNVGAVSTDPV